MADMEKAIVIAIGDSLMAGDNARIANARLPNPRPFGSPASRVRVYGRWNSLNLQERLGNAAYSGPDWTDCVPDTMNWDYLGASPPYAFCGALARHYDIKELFLINFAVPGSDASPLHPNPAASWYPTVPGGLMEKFVNAYLRPALLTPELIDGAVPVMGIFGSFGQNCTNPVFDISACNDLHLHIELIVRRVVAELGVEGVSGFYPTVVMHKNPLTEDTTPSPFEPSRVAIVRQRQELWKERAVPTQKRGLTWLENLPIEPGDTVHPSHDGQIFTGLRDFYTYVSTGISLPLLP